MLIHYIMLLCEPLCRNHMNFHALAVHREMDFCCDKKRTCLYIQFESYIHFSSSFEKPQGNVVSVRDGEKTLSYEQRVCVVDILFYELSDICVTVYLPSVKQKYITILTNICSCSCGNSGLVFIQLSLLYRQRTK